VNRPRQVAGDAKARVSESERERVAWNLPRQPVTVRDAAQIQSEPSEDSSTRLVSERQSAEQDGA
jgi:hypothetical protein